MGSGGGGSSGAVSHSEYLETVHSDWLNASGTDTIEKSITEVMDSALGNSPFAAMTAYGPDGYITAYQNVLAAYSVTLAGLASPETAWATLHAQAVITIATPAVLAVADAVVADAADPGDLAVVDAIAPADITDTVDVPGITNAEIAADVANFANDLDADILANVLPKFRRGMQDINAVVSSAFPIGEAIIYAYRDRDVAKHDSALRLDAAGKNTTLRLRNEELHLEVRKTNLNKDVQISQINLDKNVKVGSVNLTKDVDIGKANLSKNTSVETINLNKDIDVGKFNIASMMDYRKMYLQAVEQMSKFYFQDIAWEEGYARLSVEANRIAAVLKKEEAEDQKEIEEADAKWDLEVFAHGCNVMAAISGGVSGGKVKGSKLTSAVGGGLTGAAAGYAVGTSVAGSTIGGMQIGANAGYWGAAIGAVLGAAYGLLSS